jgi:PKD repeat protein
LRFSREYSLVKSPSRGLHKVKSLLALLSVILLAATLLPSAGAMWAGTPGASPHPVPPGPLRPASSDQSSSSFYASPNPDDAHVTTTFYASGLCGATACNYTYVGLPPGCTTANTGQLPCTPTATGSYDVNATATAICALLCLQWSGVTTLVVNPPVSISSITAIPAEVDVGYTTTLSMVTSGGTGPYLYSWAGLPSGCSSADTSSLSCVPAASNSYSILGSVYDTPGSSASASVALTVVPAVVVTNFVVNPSQTGVGSSVTFTVAVSGGVTPLSYSYSNLPPGCSTVDSSSFSCTPSSAGTYTVGVRVTDAEGAQSNATASLTIDSGPSITSATWTPSSVELGQTASLAVTVTGGTSPYTYTYTNLPPGCSSTDASSLTCAPAANGTYVVGVSVVDANQLTSTATATLVVNSPLGVSFTENRSSGTVPLEVAFTSHVTGGAAPFTYDWTFGDGGTATIADPSHWFQAVGNYTVKLTVQDAAGGTGSYTGKVLVSPSGGPSYTLSVFVSPGACPGVTVGTSSAANGTRLQLPAGAYTIVASACTGETFSSWTASGAASVTDTNQSSSVVRITGPGTLLAAYLAGGPPPPGGKPRGLYLSPLVRTVVLVVALVGAVWGLVYLGRRRAAKTGGSRSFGPTPPRPGGTPGDPRASGEARGSSGPPPPRPYGSNRPVTSTGPGVDSRSNSSLRTGGFSSNSSIPPAWVRSDISSPSSRPGSPSTESAARGARSASSTRWFQPLPPFVAVPAVVSAPSATPPPLAGTYLGDPRSEPIGPPSPATTSREGGFPDASTPRPSNGSATPPGILGTDPSLSRPTSREAVKDPTTGATTSPGPSPAGQGAPPTMRRGADPAGAETTRASRAGVEERIHNMVEELKVGYRDLPPSSDVRKRGSEHIQRAIEMLRTQHFGVAQIELNRAALLLRERSKTPRSGGAPSMTSR